MVQSPRRPPARNNRARSSQVSKKVAEAVLAAAQQNAETQISQRASDRYQDKSAASVARVQKYLDDYRSPADIKSLRDEGYEIDYDRLVGVGVYSAVFLAHSINAPPPPLDANKHKPLYTPGYDIAVKVVAKKWIDDKKPSKVRTGNLKLALALGQTKPENNILKVIDVFKTPERIFIFMQYCSFGNVISFIRRNGQVPSRLAKRWSIQMATALCFLHKFHVAHRNYKLENILIDENLDAKLTGFGLSKFCADLQTKQTIMSRTICGSEPYLAPEMLKEAANRVYDPRQADVWAFGVGVFLCITRKYPFYAESLRALKAEQLERRYLERDTKKRLRGSVRELLNRVFIVNPSLRPTMQDLLDQCNWLKDPTKPQPQKQPASTHNDAPKTPLRQRGPGARSPAVSPVSAVNARRSTSSTLSAAGRRGARAGPAIKQTQRQAQQPQADIDSHLSEEPPDRALSPVVPTAYQPTQALPPASRSNILSSNNEKKT